MSDLSPPDIYLIFNSIHNVMLAEELLLKDAVPVDMVPVPRELSSDCGMSLICSRRDFEKIKANFKKVTFTSEVQIYQCRKLNEKSERQFKLLLTLP